MMKKMNVKLSPVSFIKYYETIEESQSSSYGFGVISPKKSMIGYNPGRLPSKAKNSPMNPLTSKITENPSNPSHGRQNQKQSKLAKQKFISKQQSNYADDSSAGIHNSGQSSVENKAVQQVEHQNRSANLQNVPACSILNKSSRLETTQPPVRHQEGGSGVLRKPTKTTTQKGNRAPNQAPSIQQSPQELKEL